MRRPRRGLGVPRTRSVEPVPRAAPARGREALKVVFRNHPAHHSVLRALGPRGYGVIFLPPAQTRAPGERCCRNSQASPEAEDAQLRWGPLRRAPGRLPLQPAAAGARAAVRRREGTAPRAEGAGRAPDLPPSLRPARPLAPRSPPPPLPPLQPRRDHVGGDRERPHWGSGGDPGVQFQQGQQAPGPHHAVPHCGRGGPFRGGDPGEPRRAPRTPTPARPGRRAHPRLGRLAKVGVAVASPPPLIFHRFCPHPRSPILGAQTLHRSHRRIPASWLHGRPVCPSTPSPRWLPQELLRKPRVHPSFSLLFRSPLQPGINALSSLRAGSSVPGPLLSRFLGWFLLWAVNESFWRGAVCAFRAQRPPVCSRRERQSWKAP